MSDSHQACVTCPHPDLWVSSADRYRYPDAPVGLTMCCRACGAPVRPPSRAEWYAAYQTTALGGQYPYGIIRDAAGDILRPATEAEHQRWLAEAP